MAITDIYSVLNQIVFLLQVGIVSMWILAAVFFFCLISIRKRI